MEKRAEELVKTAAVVMRKMAHEIKNLRDENIALKKQAKAENLVAEMEAQGLTNSDAPHHEKVAALMKSGKDLDMLKEALALTGNNMSPFVPETTVQGDGGAVDPLTAHLLGQ